MKPIIAMLPISLACLLSCSPSHSGEDLIKQVRQTEKSFQQRTAERGIAEAFAFYADDNAVILREHDTLVKGREGIRNYYSKKDLSHAAVTWTPDFVDVSSAGDMAYTFGQYTWTVTDSSGARKEFKGVFHTVWKRQTDGSWRYVWD